MIESVLPDDVKYVKAETFFTTDASGLIVDPRQILDLKQYRLLCVNASDEDHGRGHQEIYHRRLNELAHDFLLLTGDITAHDPSRNIYWHQDSYHWSRKYFRPRDLNIQSPRAWDFSCVSRAARPQRILFYLKLRSKDLWSNVLFKLGNKNSFPRNDDIELTADENHHWSQQSKQSDIHNFQTDQPTGEKLYSFYDEPYINTYVNIVMESTCNSLAHTTEKIWKPVAAGQLFLVYGNQDTIKLLRQQGVDTFDDYIDHDLYDSEPDARRRCDLVIAAAERLAKQDILKIWHDTYQRRLINQEKFWKGHFITPHYYQLQNTILYKNR
jgi:hypothetical protein